MKSSFIILLVILIFLLTSCGPSAEKMATQTTTAATAIAASWTITPSPTRTHTPTFTPTLTPTMTPTITPTPVGGGSGQIICAFCNGKPGISLINFDGTGEIYLTDKQSIGVSFGWSKNGAKLAYFTVEGATLPIEEKRFFTCVINGANFSEQCFEIGGGSFSLSPDGSKMAIGEHSQELYLVDLDSGKSEVLMEALIQWSGWDVDWSPDGTKLLIAGDEIGITVINVLNNERTSVVEADRPDYYQTPRWSPNGKKIVYIKRSNLFVVNADGSDDTLLVRNAISPIWSPDGTKIAYITGSNDQRKIIIMNIDGTNKLGLTPSQYIAYMTWSSDGKYIVYTTFNGSRGNPIYDLYSVDVTKQQVFALAKNTGSFPTLSPDGSLIIYTSWVKMEDRYISHTYLATMDGTIISELKIPGITGPWRPAS
jgi:Tol biopolymer transport system component